MVSVIIPAYNAARFLPETVASVISQSVSDWEMLLVDDGSTDSTSDLCDTLAASDPRIRVFHKPNGGLSDARNYALDRARGEYITFLDADDLLHPDFLKETLTAASLTGMPMVAVPYYPFENSASSFLSERVVGSVSPCRLTSYEAIESACYQTPVAAAGYILDNAAWGKLYSSRLWKELRFTVGTWYEDLDIFYRILRSAGNMAFFPRPLIAYRQHPDSFLHTFSSHRADALDVVDRMLVSLRHWQSEGLPASVIRAAEVRRFAAYYNILTLIYANKAHMPEIEARCLEVIRQDRNSVVRDRNARMRDRIGALVSYLGSDFIRFISRF